MEEIRGEGLGVYLTKMYYILVKTSETIDKLNKI